MAASGKRERCLDAAALQQLLQTRLELRPSITAKRTPQSHTRTPDTTQPPREYVIPAAQPCLAEQRGLVPQTHSMPLSPAAWLQVRRRYASRYPRQQVPECAICREAMQLRRQVLLSCTHTYHLACLQNIEAYLQRKRCPLCRADDYQTMVIDDAWHRTRFVAAQKIQALVRGWQARKQWRAQLEARFCRNPTLARRYCQTEVNRFTAQVLSARAAASEAVEDFLVQLERDQAERQAILRALGASAAATASQAVDWPAVAAQVRSRPERDCPICLQAIPDGAAALLRCSHCFHQPCLEILDRFHDSGSLPDLRCPVCRDTLVRCPHPI